MKSLFIFRFFKKALFTLAMLLLVLRCADDELMLDATSQITANDLNVTTTSSIGIMDCSSCDYIVPEGEHVVDAAELGLAPGSIIGLNANYQYGYLIFRNIVGTPENPIIIKNCGGTVFIDGTDRPNALATQESKYLRITGGDIDQSYGIKITGGHMGISLGAFTTDVSVDHVEIMNSGFAGIMAKTDPTCDDRTIRGNFLMENVEINHNYIHDTGGEGIYAGNSFYAGMQRECGLRLPHEIHNIAIHHNIVKNTGWEAIQLGCATQGAAIHDNRVENYGLANKPSQYNGIQISSGTNGLCYNNLIKNGLGTGMTVFGLGDNIIFNNIIENAGNYGIFADERASTGSGFKFINNTIINPASDGIRIYSELLPMNVVVNNIIVNPGTGVFVARLRDEVKIEMANNYFTTGTDSLQLHDGVQPNYAMENTSAVIDKGADISAYSEIAVDYYNNPRLNGEGYDIGAIETVTGAPTPAPNSVPVVYAGADRSINLPDNSLYIDGSATDSDGSIVSYQWRKVSGGSAILDGETSTKLHVTNLEAGTYTFRLTATDDSGASASDEIKLSVLSEDNAIPVANAGPNQTIALPKNSTTLYGSGADTDGTIESYQWTQYGGAPTVITNAGSATATVSGLVEGKYYFRLTVMDNRGATHFDNMLIRVEPNDQPVANAGPNQIITLPQNSTVLNGTGTDNDGSIVSYKWTQYGGPIAILGNSNSATATVGGLVVGKYYFRLTVTDDDGATHYDNMLIKVEGPLDGTISPEANLAPEANAGPNQVLAVPVSSTVLHGTATDVDGTIEEIIWQQYGGQPVNISNANDAAATITGLTVGNFYFKMTVKDDDGAIDSDNMLIKVLESEDI